MSALDLACELATRPRFDCLFDPDPSTPTIEPYHDPIGYPTQGYGRLLSRKRWAPLSQWPAVTKADAWDDLVLDMRTAERAVARLCPVPLSDGQAAALMDFAFNCGAGNLQASTLRQCVIRGDFDQAAREFGKWVYGGGVKLGGLVRRRQAETDLWLSGV